jgi:hypothetical protein
VWKRTPQTTTVTHRIFTLPAGKRKGPAGSLAKLRRYLKSVGAVPVTSAMKRRLIAAGEWGMPDE